MRNHQLLLLLLTLIPFKRDFPTHRSSATSPPSFFFFQINDDRAKATIHDAPVLLCSCTHTDTKGEVHHRSMMALGSISGGSDERTNERMLRALLHAMHCHILVLARRLLTINYSPSTLRLLPRYVAACSVTRCCYYYYY